MDTINYSKNWNGKLFQDFHGTIREVCHQKYFVGNTLRETLNGVEMGVSKVVAIREFQFHLIRDPIAYLDCGHDARYLAQLLTNFYCDKGTLKPDHLFMHVVLHYEKRNLENQEVLLKEWWASKQQLQLDL